MKCINFISYASTLKGTEKLSTKTGDNGLGKYVDGLPNSPG